VPSGLCGAWQSPEPVGGLGQRGVSYRCKGYRAKRRTRHKTTTLEPQEFKRRYLLDVLPGGFHRIRHYGVPANGRRRNYQPAARATLQGKAEVPVGESATRRPVFIAWTTGDRCSLSSRRARAPLHPSATPMSIGAKSRHQQAPAHVHRKSALSGLVLSAVGTQSSQFAIHSLPTGVVWGYRPLHRIAMATVPRTTAATCAAFSSSEVYTTPALRLA
jgi:hypothetical protein